MEHMFFFFKRFVKRRKSFPKIPKAKVTKLEPSVQDTRKVQNIKRI